MRVHNVCAREAIDNPAKEKSDSASGIAWIEHDSDNRKLKVAFGSKFARFFQRGDLVEGLLLSLQIAVVTTLVTGVAPARHGVLGNHVFDRARGEVVSHYGDRTEVGVGVETADMLVREVLSRQLRDQRAVARYAGLTGSPDESGSRRREKGLAKAGNARVRRGLIQLAWRFLRFQPDSALAQWYRRRTTGPAGARKTTMVAALARKLLIALWRMATTGSVPEGVVLRPAA